MYAGFVLYRGLVVVVLRGRPRLIDAGDPCLDHLLEVADALCLVIVHLLFSLVACLFPGWLRWMF